MTWGDKTHLTDYHIRYMVNHMKTTLNLSSAIMRLLKQESVKQNRTMTELVETALRTLFQNQTSADKLSPLPEYDCGGARINVANREVLYEIMEHK